MAQGRTARRPRRPIAKPTAGEGRRPRPRRPLDARRRRPAKKARRAAPRRRAAKTAEEGRAGEEGARRRRAAKPAKKAAPAKKAPAPAKKAPAKKAAEDRDEGGAGEDGDQGRRDRQEGRADEGRSRSRRRRARSTVICPLSGFEVKPETPGLSPKTLERLKARLLEERDRATSHQADELAAEAEQLATEREGGDTQFDEESGEGDTVNVERERDLLLSASARQIVDEIDRALERIEDAARTACARPPGGASRSSGSRRCP